MYGKVKLTKRQIKEDKFTTLMLTWKSIAEDNWQFLVIGVAAVVLLVVGAIYFTGYQADRVDQAAEKFARTMLDYRNGNSQIAILGFTQILDEHGDDAVAQKATFLLGNLHLASRNYDEAIRHYDLFLNKYRGNSFERAAALAGKATTLENQGLHVQAAQAFSAACDESADGPLVGDYLAGSLRNYLEAGDNAAAEEKLKIIVKKFEKSDLAIESARLYAEKATS